MLHLQSETSMGWVDQVVADRLQQLAADEAAILAEGDPFPRVHS